ncbi:response regulator [Prosthecobacter sp.]|uniref:hybrid sensor histidine kinase/response regulator n=1 Tax=Prosthecobacter sp. TaxID=1965333 RepID=UPI002AB8E354|nr:response regulator [Prosthecobacter sp.]MDZ4404524.1 response regulator [Prosthecobacter sp.]
MPAVDGSASEKNEFLTSMGHELRNPLASIIAHAETLMEGVYGPLESAQKTALTAVQASARHMLHLVADVMDLRRLETGSSSLAPTACLVNENSASSMKLVAELARSRSAHIVSEIHPQNLRVMADARRLQQLISELLSAAILSIPIGGRVRLCIAASNGGLHLQTHSSSSQTSSATLHPSANEEDARHSPLLRRLRKVKPIGMALLQKLVQLQEGTFTVRETAEHVVSMSIHLPLSILPSTEPSHEQSPPECFPADETPHAASSHSPTILIADDQPALITVTRNYLESLGFHVITARDGREAVHQAFTLRPDLILMDVRMPVVDGLHAIRQIRESSDPKIRNITIVSLSGHAGEADKEKCLAAGATAYLNKPFGVKELNLIIADFIQPHRP